MTSLDMEVIKDIPGYKVILKAVLRAQIQQLVKQLSEHTEEESVILTANVTDGTLSHLGSDYGKMFLETYSDVKKSFLGFCLQSHHSKQTLDGSNQTTVTTQDKTKLPYNSKLHTKVLAKPRHSPYTSSRPQSNGPSGLKKGSSGILSKSDGVVEKNDKTSTQDKGETDDPNSINLMEVQVKQEPEDVTDETSDNSVKEHTNIDWNKSVESIGKGQLTLDSEVDSLLNASNKSVNTPLSLLDYSDSLNQGAGQWADNSDFKANRTDHIGFHESIHGSDSSIERGRKKGEKSAGVRTLVPKSPVCQFCSKTFNNKSNLVRHTRIHTGAKPYSCEICFKTFNQSTSKKKHMITHMAIYEKLQVLNDSGNSSSATLQVLNDSGNPTSASLQDLDDSGNPSSATLQVLNDLGNTSSATLQDLNNSENPSSVTLQVLNNSENPSSATLEKE